MEDIISNLDLKNRLILFKKDLLLSKKYSLIYILLLLILTLTRFEAQNYLHPKMEIFGFILLSIMGVFCIAYYIGHKADEELYKTAFIILLIFGIVCSFILPICYGPDEVEHFVRSEMTSRGVLFPEYVNGSYKTIQSILDLIEVGKVSYGPFDDTDLVNSSIFKTSADTQPINDTLVNYPNAFVQNPFYGYLAQGIGIFIAKLFNLNAIWLLWLGRIFNTILYATLGAIAVKKSPILKIPLIAFACLPFAVYLEGTISIDALMGGVGLLIVAYFFYLYKCPKITYKHIIKFTLLVIVLGTCKVTYFAFIFLLIFIPRVNFAEKKYYLYGFLAIIVSGIFALLWSKYYAFPGYYQSGFRIFYAYINNINSTQQMSFILSHKRQTLVEMIQIFGNFNSEFLFTDFMFKDIDFNLMNLFFIGAITFFYPTEKYNIRTRLGVLIMGVILYVGTYVSSLLSWTPVGQISLIEGVQLRYFMPFLAFLPFIFSFNHMEGDKSELDTYIIVLTVTFISIRLMGFITAVY